MPDAFETVGESAIKRAELSHGTSAERIYQRAAAIINELHRRGGRVLDVGCGTGSFRPFLAESFDEYIGVDAVRYAKFPADAQFFQADLDAPRWPIPDNSADVSVSIETIEHLENPRAFFREMERITQPGGLIVVSTPNQLSLLSKLSLLLKNQFVFFLERPGLYPAHRTALVEIDLVHIASETGLRGVRVDYGNQGRIPGTAKHWPAALGMTGRAFSDNVFISAIKP